MAVRPWPETVIGLACPITVVFRRLLLTGWHEAVYRVIGAPLFFGALKKTFNAPLPAFFTVGLAGCAGAPITIWPVYADAGPLPTAFVATTLKRNAVAFFRP